MMAHDKGEIDRIIDITEQIIRDRFASDLFELKKKVALVLLGEEATRARITSLEKENTDLKRLRGAQKDLKNIVKRLESENAGLRRENLSLREENLRLKEECLNSRREWLENEKRQNRPQQTEAELHGTIPTNSSQQNTTSNDNIFQLQYHCQPETTVNGDKNRPVGLSQQVSTEIVTHAQVGAPASDPPRVPVIGFIKARPPIIPRLDPEIIMIDSDDD